MTTDQASPDIARRKDRSEAGDDEWDELTAKQYLVRQEAGYRVYIEEDFTIEWEASEAYQVARETNPEIKLKLDPARENQMFVGVAILEGRPHARLERDARMQFLRLVGEAVVCTLEYDYAAAQFALTKAEQFFDARSEELSRYWYLTASVATFVVFAIGGSIIWLTRVSLTPAIGQTLFWMTIAGMAGATGALLSIISRSGKLKIDNSVSQKLHYFEASMRIVAGAIGGAIAGLAVKTELIVGAFTSGENKYVATVLVALAAGAGERLVGSIVSRLDGAEPVPDTNKPATGT